jgi:hypothetical protein
MKMMSATLVSLALMSLAAAPAAAETQYPSTMSGTVKIEVMPQDQAKATSAAKPGETLTIRFVEPAKPPAVDDDDIGQRLTQCGEKWNRKLDAHQAHLSKLRRYLAYYDKWEGYPAQRPPKSPEPVLTRASYRACIYECLGDRRVTCPGGWPKDDAKK